MDEPEARRILRSLRSELDEAVATFRAANKRASTIRKLIEGYVELFPSLTNDVPENVVSAAEDRPRGQSAVREVLTGNPGKWYTVKLMTRELHDRDWLPASDQPENAVRTALTRIAETDDHVRKGVGEKTGQITFAWFDELPDLEPPAASRIQAPVGGWPPAPQGAQHSQEVNSP